MMAAKEFPQAYRLKHRATRRQDAANEHQQNVTNLGFVAFSLKEMPTGCRHFP